MDKNRREVLKCMTVAGLLTQPVSAWSIASDTRTTVTVKGSAFGTHWHFTITKNAHLQDALLIIRQTLRLVDQSMSPYLPDSEVTLFNQDQTTQLELSSLSGPVVSASLEVARTTRGAFDPTVGPLVNKSGFGPIQGSLKSRYSDLALNNNVLRKQAAGTTIDLCGIAKGYALDLIAASLADQGYSDFLIEIGGEIRANGTHPSGRDWLIGLEMPTRVAKAQFPAGCNAVATSGIAKQSYLYNKKLNSHLINPLIETAQSESLYSVSVFHPSGMMADAWSTALFVMGRDSAVECANQNELDAVIVSVNHHSDDSKQYEYITTGEAKLHKENT